MGLIDTLKKGLGAPLEAGIRAGQAVRQQAERVGTQMGKDLRKSTARTAELAKSGAEKVKDAVVMEPEDYKAIGEAGKAAADKAGSEIDKLREKTKKPETEG